VKCAAEFCSTVDSDYVSLFLLRRLKVDVTRSDHISDLKATDSCCCVAFARVINYVHVVSQTWLFSSTSMYHSTDLLTVRGVAYLVVHGTSGSTSYETIPHVQFEISGDVLSTADMVVQRRDGPGRLREIDDDDESRVFT